MCILELFLRWAILIMGILYLLYFLFGQYIPGWHLIAKEYEFSTTKYLYHLFYTRTLRTNSVNSCFMHKTLIRIQIFAKMKKSSAFLWKKWKKIVIKRRIKIYMLYIIFIFKSCVAKTFLRCLEWSFVCYMYFI